MPPPPDNSRLMTNLHLAGLDCDLPSPYTSNLPHFGCQNQGVNCQKLPIPSGQLAIRPPSEQIRSRTAAPVKCHTLPMDNVLWIIGGSKNSHPISKLLTIDFRTRCFFLRWQLRLIIHWGCLELSEGRLKVLDRGHSHQFFHQ
jgi:hypothetical protein